MTIPRQLTVGPFTTGLDNVSLDGNLLSSSARDAVNVNFDASGDTTRREGYVSALTLSGAHSLWTSPVTRASYCAAEGHLCRAHVTAGVFSAVALYGEAVLADDSTLSFDDVNDGVAYTNAGEVGLIYTDRLGTEYARPLGVENPPIPTVSNDAAGNLPAGRYAVAVSFSTAFEESGLSPLALVSLNAGEGLRIDVPQPDSALVTYVNLYRSEQNGDLLYFAARIPVGISSYLLGSGQLGRLANNQFQERMPPGTIVRYWNGRLLVASGNALYFSQAMRYGRYDPRTDFVQFPRDITAVEPVLGGVFVGTEDTAPVFLSGGKPSDFVWRQTGGEPMIAGCSTRIKAAQLGGDLSGSGQQHALWLAQNGYVLGTADGTIIELNRGRVQLPAAQWSATGTLVVHERRVLAVIN